MTSKTKTAATAHGQVEYEVVECDSCGNDVAKQDAKRFVITDDYRTFAGNVKFTGDYIDGYACPHCADVGPIGYPSYSRWERFKQLTRPLWYDPDYGCLHEGKLIGVAMGLLLAGIFLIEFVL